ncbi:MAG TPA: diacylglycerol kinase family protein [Thermoanaerobaculia bacterium]|nr:diacylglycerol kinase family protein [Thermoanaerobaculia bacterium]
MKPLFVVNARSGRSRNRDVPAIIREQYDLAKADYELFACEAKEQLDDLVARARRERFDVLYAVGGDGTVHELAKRLIGTEIALGIVPTGSGNGFARHVGLPIETRKTLTASRNGRIVTIDTATVNGIPFVGVMGAGFDAAVAHRFGATRGLRNYLREGIAAFAAYRPAEYEIDVDGQTMRRRAYVITVANSSQYGNNARIAPLASLQDGLLDLVAIDNVSLLSALPLLVRLFNGTMHRSANATVAQGKRIVIRRETEGPAHLDGEPLILGAELDVRIVPNSLRVLVPAGRQQV